ncbi:2Fe-2S iron-sulfur cluster-binding protein [Pseudonocardia acaciae]|uniref:2Fe-2S iron-sulfur cluster-binding protein n=1 Tax=Pseudonocardia acaciae TaxID=551276 RepID=UPI001FE04BCC|nr:2Fe-2S iron-sulfur cluster-binding protein [Pseudonocardia acaciae]
MLFGYAALALVMAQLPPLIPPSFPGLHAPGWYLIAVCAFGAGVLASARRAALGLCWPLLVVTLLQGFLVGDLIAMFCSWLVVPAFALLAGRLSARGRKALLAVHVVSAACWTGIAAVFVALSVVAMSTEKIQVAAVSYELMGMFDITLLPWANFATSLTGLALGLTTRWGLVTYHWVATKLAISVGVLVMAFGFLHDALESAAEQSARLAASGGAANQVTEASDVVFWGFGVALVSLVGALLLSLYKPGGKTPWGRRRTAGTRRATVAEVRAVADETVALTLRAPGGGALPGWSPGAHVDLVLPSGLVRQYSLYGDPEEKDAYRVAVLREPDGRGGSAEIHRLRPGARVGIRGPRNNFPLVAAPGYLFIAGGIGITPLLPMIRRVHRDGAPWRLVYRGRTLPGMAFAAALVREYGDRVTLLPSDTHARPHPRELFGDTPDGVAVYCCGPESLLAAVERAMPEHRPHGTLHTERFAARDRTGDGPGTEFEAQLASTGEVIRVPAGRGLLEAIREVDPGIDASCEDGVCGSCVTRVLAGVPDHRDSVLEAHERDRTDVIYPCVSRARGGRIVLDR